MFVARLPSLLIHQIPPKPAYLRVKSGASQRKRQGPACTARRTMPTSKSPGAALKPSGSSYCCSGRRRAAGAVGR